MLISHKDEELPRDITFPPVYFSRDLVTSILTDPDPRHI